MLQLQSGVKNYEELMMYKIILYLLLGVIITLHAKTMQEYETLSQGERVAAKATIAYSEPFLFDYDTDGTKNKLVMAAKLFIKKTNKGYEGYLVRGLYDLKRKMPIAYYENALLMHPPSNTYIAISDIQFKGKTVSFKSGPFYYTFKDGGDGKIQDEVLVKIGNKTKKIHIYDGDVTLYQ